MKLISLNTWGGRVYEPLVAFVKRMSSEVDVFCFQEVYHDVSVSAVHPEEQPDLFHQFEKLLPDFKGYFAPMLPGIGIAMFVRAGIPVESVHTHSILSADEVSRVKRPDGGMYYPRVVQSVLLRDPKAAIYNFHGIPGDGKGDTPERELQTRRLLEAMEQNKDSKILIGDFNLNPDAQSLSAFESTMRSLVKESGVFATRSRFYAKKDVMPFADYALVSEGITVKEFKVLPDEVSDHLALYLEFE